MAEHDCTTIAGNENQINHSQQFWGLMETCKNSLVLSIIVGSFIPCQITQIFWSWKPSHLRISPKINICTGTCLKHTCKMSAF